MELLTSATYPGLVFKPVTAGLESLLGLRVGLNPPEPIIFGRGPLELPYMKVHTKNLQKSGLRWGLGSIRHLSSNAMNELSFKL